MLQELEFEIVHRRGKKHTNADALSRLPCRKCGRDTHDSLVPAIVAVVTLRSPQGNASEELRDAQLVDPVLGPLLRGKEAGRKPSADELGSVSRSSRRLLQIWDQLIVHGGVLGHRFETPEGSSTILQTIVPEALLKEVLAGLHEGALGGHLGADKTLARLKERFYWPGHFNDVREWCRNCGTCASRKSPVPKGCAPLNSVETGYPMQLVAMDIVGPFPESPAGNTHILVVADYFTRWTEATIIQQLLSSSWIFKYPGTGYMNIYLIDNN